MLLLLTSSFVNNLENIIDESEKPNAYSDMNIWKHNNYTNWIINDIYRQILVVC